ncbi:MAG: gluconate 2-dehydrogenase subunit 3 family protein [Bacteroidota bacterium]
MIAQRSELPHASRRRFLRRTLVGSAVLSTASLLPSHGSTMTGGGGNPLDLKFFSTDEYHILRAAAERIVGAHAEDGPTATEINVALRADRFLAAADPEIQEQFHLLLTVMNHPFFTFLFDFRLSAFVNMPAEDQDTYLEDWMTSPLGFRRQAFVGLKRLCMSMYYTDPRSWPGIGYDGVFSL